MCRVVVVGMGREAEQSVNSVELCTVLSCMGKEGAPLLRSELREFSVRRAFLSPLHISNFILFSSSRHLYPHHSIYPHLINTTFKMADNDAQVR